MSKEIWKDINGYEGKYQVSNHGQVKSLRYGKQKILSLGDNGHGYLRVGLCVNRIVKSYLVHILVLETFYKKRPAGLDGSHLDGNSLNNKLSNLTWENRSENCLRMRNHGTSSKITEETVIEIKKMLKTDMSQLEISKKFNVSHGTVNRINTGVTWKHVKE